MTRVNDLTTKFWDVSTTSNSCDKPGFSDYPISDLGKGILPNKDPKGRGACSLTRLVTRVRATADHRLMLSRAKDTIDAWGLWMANEPIEVDDPALGNGDPPLHEDQQA